MRERAECLYYLLCLVLGRILRSARYARSSTQPDGVRKHRVFYAPLVIWLGGPLLEILDTGVRVLPQQAWEEREQAIYRRVYVSSIRVEGDRTLVLPRFAGDTLASLLEDSTLHEPARRQAIERAVFALADFHRLGLTHADAMAENVMVDLDAGIARWFDFETVHDPNRSVAWRRADDLRALLTTCLLRTAPEKHAATVECILDAYADDDVNRALAASFTSVWRRSLPFHLAQAGLSLRCLREIAGSLKQR